MSVRIWEVGGHVRDSLLGIQSKDIDMAVEASGWEAMREFVKANTQKIFLEKPEFLTIRAMGHDGLPKDFVLCRRDGDYSDGRRPDSVEPGTILDDLSRRDFTVNAIARDPETGKLFDPFGGKVDLEKANLRCVGDTFQRFDEDSLRILRAVRFSIVKGFRWTEELESCIEEHAFHWASKLRSVSPERIREEMLKCFRHDTFKTMLFLHGLPTPILTMLFDESGIWLKPTLEER